MSRFHLHLSVTDLDRSIAYYSALFGSAPDVTKPDYAKWQLEDPRLNFAISTRGRNSGIDHLGIQADSDEELAAIRGRLDVAEISGLEQRGTTCCYARSDKYWVQDPQGIAWETFHTLDSAPVFGDVAQDASELACCVPQLSATKCCG